MQPHDTTNDIPYGYCHCGCGQRTPIAKKSHTRLGHIAGQPMRFVKGHHNRNRKRPAEDRFWEKVDKRGPDDCWEWTASRELAGYGQFWDGNRRIGAHRFAYALVHGPIADDVFVCHRCDNPACVNPAHLFVGTPRDNTIDMVTKGRWHGPVIRHGESNASAKLTKKDVKEIRRLSQKGERAEELAARYNVSAGTIYHIRQRRSWTHI